MKRLGIITKWFCALLAAILVLGSVCIAAEDEYEVVINVVCAENMIFSTYDVDVYIDNEKIGTVPHGKEQTFSLTLSAGTHEVLFTEENDKDVSGSTQFVLSMGEIQTYSISCYSGRVDIDDQVREVLITDAMKEAAVQLENAFPQEDAKRAAVVAMTNGQATDVFKKDGITYNTSKFHAYNDYSGYFLSVIDEGTWWAVDESTWHVEGMKFIMSGTGVHMKASMNITKEKKALQVSTVDKYIGLLEDLDKGNSELVYYEHIEPSDNTPYLTVTTKLISKDRDEEALNDWLHRTTPTAARKSWIEKQFSWWDGSHDKLTELIKDRLNDERSYKHIETTYIDITTQEKLDTVNKVLKKLGTKKRAEMGDVLVMTEFSAKNAFNATIKSMAYGLVSYELNNVTLIAIE